MFIIEQMDKLLYTYSLLSNEGEKKDNDKLNKIKKISPYL